MNLPKGQTELSKDTRPIKAIAWDDAEQSHFKVGQSGVTRIEAYDENGSMSFVPWLAVFKGDDIVHRCPADQVSIGY